MGKAFLSRRVGERPPRNLAPARGADPAGLHQHVARAFRYLHAANGLVLGAADRLVIGDDRQSLDRGAAETAALLALTPKDMGEIGGGLEMPASAALDQLDAAPGIMALKLGQCGLHLHSIADIERDIGGAHRLFGREQSGLNRAQGVVHLPHSRPTPCSPAEAGAQAGAKSWTPAFAGEQHSGGFNPLTPPSRRAA